VHDDLETRLFAQRIHSRVCLQIREASISGTAQAYISVTPDPLQPDGRWDSQPNPGVTAPYTTRVLVRRPLDRARFNGTVVVEWLNESGGSEATADWWYMHDEIVRQGYAYVGVTVQWPGVQSLLGWETGPGARYLRPVDGAQIVLDASQSHVP
jgi:hypothetical protein